jgi:hypothetical protein
MGEVRNAPDWLRDVPGIVFVERCEVEHEPRGPAARRCSKCRDWKPVSEFVGLSGSVCAGCRERGVKGRGQVISFGRKARR